MCTVTFIPAKDRIYLTSNRDEKHWRTAALPPAAYKFASGKMLFPKDGDAGGTWVAAHENGNAIVFLNGGLVAHIPKPPYRKSRGLILLDLLESYSAFNSFQLANLNGIEPFTAIIWDDRCLFECRWDGSQKHSSQLDNTIPHIWSSVTLYDEAVISKRKQWFQNWLQVNKKPARDAILQFHQFTGDGDQHNDLRMNRDGKVMTVSVTSVDISHAIVSMHYLDLKNDQAYKQELAIAKTMVSR